MAKNFESKPILMLLAHRFSQARWFWAIFFLGLCLRGWALYSTVLINPDGALYIFQAKAIFNFQWHILNSCSLSFVSVHSILIAFAHLFIRDWILSAQLISFIFSTATLIPLYLYCRCFCDESIALLTLLIAALNPVMCSNAGEVVRDPTFWFFIAFGLYFTVRYFDHSDRNYLLVLSCTAFALAAWARIEAILLLCLTPVILVFLGKKGIWRRLLSYCLPISIIAGIAIFLIVAYKIPIQSILRLGNFDQRVAGSVINYKYIAAEIEHLTQASTSERLSFFLPEVKNHIWLIGLGTMLNRALEAFFYPFVIFLVTGLWQYPKRPCTKVHYRYALTTTICAFFLLYLHLLNAWIMEYRFMMLLMIPAIPFFGAGIQWWLKFVVNKWSINQSNVIAIAAGLMVLTAVPKNIQTRDPDKIVFRNIAETARSMTPINEPVLISSSIHTHQLLTLYANIDLDNPLCHDVRIKNSWSKYSSNIDLMIQDLKTRNIHFFLYEEKNWPLPNFDTDRLLNRTDLLMIGHWKHRDTGLMKLYKIQ